MASELRMCDRDRDDYGGPEWVLFDLDALLDVPCQTLEEWEDVTGLPVTDMYGPARRTARGIRAMLWIARRQAKLEDNWETFNPRVLRVESRCPDCKQQRMCTCRKGDADPPEGTPESSEDTGSELS